MLGAIFALSTSDRGVLPVVKGVLGHELGLSNRFYGALFTTFLVAYTITYLFVGSIVVRLGIRGALAASVSLMSFAVALCGFAHSRYVMLPALGCLGIAQALVVPSITVAIFEWFPTARRAFAYSVVNALQSTAGILCPTIVALAALWGGWRMAFLIPASAGFAMTLIWWQGLSRRPPAAQTWPSTSHPKRLSHIDLLHNPFFRRLMLARLVSDPLWFFLQCWQVPFLQERIGLNLREVSALAWIPPAASMAIVAVFGAASDRMSGHPGAELAGRVKPMVWISLLAPSVCLLPFVSRPSTAILLCAVGSSVCCVWMSISTVLVGSLVPAESRAGAIGLMSAVGCVSSAVFNAVAGVLIDRFGYDLLFVIGGTLYPLAAAILVLGAERLRDGTAAAPQNEAGPEHAPTQA